MGPVRCPQLNGDETHRQRKDLLPQHELPPAPHVLLRRRALELVHLRSDLVAEHFLIKWTRWERCEESLDTFRLRGRRHWMERRCRDAALQHMPGSHSAHYRPSP